jgi:Protein of unknown function (DUF2489)
MSLPDTNSGTAEQNVAQIAQAILDGRISIIAGARQIRRFCGGHAGLDEHDPDLSTFVGIDSKTDDLPIGDVRQYWAPDALAQKDLEIARCEAIYRESAVDAASHLIVRFTRDT